MNGVRNGNSIESAQMLKTSAEDAHLEGLAGLVFPGNLQGGRERDELSLVHCRFAMRISGLWVPTVPAAGGRGRTSPLGPVSPFAPGPPGYPGSPFSPKGPVPIT